MRTTGPGLLDSVGLAALTADVKSLLQDTDTGQNVAVSIASSTSVNYATGASTTTEATANLTAWVAPLTWKQMQESPEYQTGDVSVLLVVGDLEGVELSKQARLTIASKPYEVLSVKIDPLNIHAQLISRRRA
jgi:hypothetical protein